MYTKQNLENLLQECYNEIEEKIGGTYYADYFKFKKDCITIDWGHTTGTRLGACKYHNITYTFDYWGRRTSIKDIGSFSIIIYDHKNRDIKGIKETIIHELIHTLKNCQNHKSEFKWHCEIIQRYLGYSCWSGSHDDVKQVDYKLNNYKHFLICSKCNKILRQSNRMTIKYRKPQNYSCRACGTTCEYADSIKVKQILGVV